MKKKLKIGKYSMIFLLILILCLLMSLAQVFLKRGVERVGKINLNDFISRKIIEMIKERNLLWGLSLYVISTLLWLVILSRAELSLVYPLVALSYLFGVVLAKVILDESITLLRWVGAIIIVIGVFFILKS